MKTLSHIALRSEFPISIIYHNTTYFIAGKKENKMYTTMIQLKSSITTPVVGTYIKWPQNGMFYIKVKAITRYQVTIKLKSSFNVLIHYKLLFLLILSTQISNLMSTKN